MTPGTMYQDQDFVFHDGVRGNKILIILGSENGVSIVVKTTSKGYAYNSIFGCQCKDRHPNFHLVQNCCVLPLATWVCLNEYYEIPDTAILRKHFSGGAKDRGVLPDDIRDALVKCAIDSLDISPFQESVIKSSIR